MSSSSDGSKNKYSKCIVPFCSSPNDIKYFELPNNPKRREEWLEKIKPIQTLKKRNKVCQLHFIDSDFECDLKSQLLGLKPNKKLKIDAIPSAKLTLPNIPQKNYPHNNQLNQLHNNPLNKSHNNPHNYPNNQSHNNPHNYPHNQSHNNPHNYPHNQLHNNPHNYPLNQSHNNPQNYPLNQSHNNPQNYPLNQSHNYPLNQSHIHNPHNYPLNQSHNNPLNYPFNQSHNNPFNYPHNTNIYSNFHDKLHDKQHNNSNLHDKLHDSKLHDTNLHDKLHDSKLHDKLHDSKLHDSNLHDKLHDSKLHDKLHDSKLHDSNLHTKLHDSNLHDKLHDSNLPYTLHSNLHDKLHDSNLQDEIHFNLHAEPYSNLHDKLHFNSDEKCFNLHNVKSSQYNNTLNTSLSINNSLLHDNYTALNPNKNTGDGLSKNPPDKTIFKKPKYRNTESQTSIVKVIEPKLRNDFSAQCKPHLKTESVQVKPNCESKLSQISTESKNKNLQVKPDMKSNALQVNLKPSVASVSCQKIIETKSSSTQKSNKYYDDKIKRYKNKLRLAESQLSKVKKENKILKSKKHVNSILKERLAVRFTDAQAHIIVNNNKNGKWQKEDITNGLIIKSFSKRSYEYLRDTCKLPFPSLSTLRDWTKNFETNPGIQYDILNVIKEKINPNSDPIKRLVVISFDEMALRNEISYCQKYEKIYKGAKQIQVVTVRSLVDNWKQPIYFDFDQAVTKELLFEIIKELHKINLIVCAMTSDMGGSNKALWNKLNITTEKTYFQNPEMETIRVYVLADACHLLKNVRNHLLDNGFKLKDGSKITQKPLISLISNVDTGEFRCTHKLQMIHLNCKSSERQRVFYATQLLSNSTSEALRLMFKNDKEAQDLSKFIKVVDSWFDVMNSSHTQDHKDLKCAFGLHYNLQKKALLEAIDVFTHLNQITCPRKTEKLKPYQFGLIISTKSLMGLYDHLKSQFNLKYILTTRLNSDNVENFFSRLRDMCGTHRTPNCAEVISRFRIMTISRNAEFAVKTAAVKCENEMNDKQNEDYEEVTFNDISKTVEELSNDDNPENIDEELLNDINLMLSDIEGFDNLLDNSDETYNTNVECEFDESVSMNQSKNEVESDHELPNILNNKTIVTRSQIKNNNIHC